MPTPSNKWYNYVEEMELYDIRSSLVKSIIIYAYKMCLSKHLQIDHFMALTSKANVHIPVAGLASMPNEKTVTLEKEYLHQALIE